MQSTVSPSANGRGMGGAAKLDAAGSGSGNCACHLASCRGTPPGLVQGMMAGLLTCGSQRPCPFPAFQASGSDRFARRLQLRGQSRTWQMLTSAAPDSLFILPSPVDGGRNHLGQG